jgi:aldose 1-epimerase
MSKRKTQSGFSIDSNSFGKVNECEATLYNIKHEQEEFEVSISDFGATLVNVKWQNRSLTLSHASASDYATQPSYFGASVGRVANRIANGKFELEGL